MQQGGAGSVYRCVQHRSDLTNSNADAFHSGMGEIVAMPVEEISDSLHVGYLLQKNVAVSAAMAVFLDYLRDDIIVLKKTL